MTTNDLAYLEDKNVFAKYNMSVQSFVEEIVFTVYYFCLSIYLYFYISRFFKVPNVMKVAKSKYITFRDLLVILQ